MNSYDMHSIDSLKNIAKIKENGGNFQTIKNHFGEARLTQLIRSLYPRYTLPQLEKLTNIPDSTLEYWLTSLKIPRTGWHMRSVSIPSNSNYEDVIKYGRSFRKRFRIKITQELAYIIGFALGDGSVDKYSVDFFNKDRGLYYYLYGILKDYDLVLERPSRGDDLWRLRLDGVRIARLIKNDKKLNTKTINYIFKREKLAESFIAAFWDAEGRVAQAPDSYSYFHIYLYNTNKYLLDKIGAFLRKRDIKYSVHSRFDRKRRYMLKGRLIRATKPIHRISIPTAHRLTWANQIGIHMKHSKKRQVVEEILNR